MKKNLEVKRLQTNRRKGYCKIPKGIFELLNEGISSSELVTYLYLFIVATDWDTRHELTHAKAPYSMAQIASSLNLNASTISKHIKNLMKHKLVVRDEYGQLAVACYKEINYLMSLKEVTVINPAQIARTRSGTKHKHDEDIDIDEILHELDINERLENFDKEVKTDDLSIP